MGSDIYKPLFMSTSCILVEHVKARFECLEKVVRFEEEVRYKTELNQVSKNDMLKTFREHSLPNTDRVNYLRFEEESYIRFSM